MHGHDHEHHHRDYEHHHDHRYHHHHEHDEYRGTHTRVHANDIERRFDGREVTSQQTLLSGLTGGPIPCPTTITVLLICIRLKALTLGTTLATSFDIGLTLTLVIVDTGTAISVQQVAERWSGFNTLAKRTSYFSSLLIGSIGVYMGVHDFMSIMRQLNPLGLHIILSPGRFLDQLFPLILCSLRMLLGHSLIYIFYEIIGSLTKYRLPVILYGRKNMRLVLQIPKVESL